MKKIFLAATFCFLMICSTASAQDIYASSNNGYDYYVVSESVNEREYKHNENGKTYNVCEVTCNVKLLRGNKLLEIQAWKFVSINHRTWQYSINGQKAGGFYNSKSLYAMKILETTGRWH